MTHVGNHSLLRKITLISRRNGNGDIPQRSVPTFGHFEKKYFKLKALYRVVPEMRSLQSGVVGSGHAGTVTYGFKFAVQEAFLRVQVSACPRKTLTVVETWTTGVELSSC